MGLLCFGLALREHGWRITYLGAETPLREITDALGELLPSVVVLSAISQQRFLDASEEITRSGDSSARGHRRGRRQPRRSPRAMGVELLGGDAIGEAAGLAA